MRWPGRELRPWWARSTKPTPARKKSEVGVIISPPPPVFRCAGGGPRPPAPARSPTAPIVPARGCLRSTVRLLPYPPATLLARRPTSPGSAHSDRGAMFPVSRTPGLVGIWRWANPSARGPRPGPSACRQSRGSGAAKGARNASIGSTVSPPSSLLDAGTMTKNSLLLLAAACFMVGCTQQWAKPGATEADLHIARSQCEARAQSAFPLALMMQEPARRQPEQIIIQNDSPSTIRTSCTGFGNTVDCVQQRETTRPLDYISSLPPRAPITVDHNEAPRAPRRGCLPAGTRLAHG